METLSAFFVMKPLHVALVAALFYTSSLALRLEAFESPLGRGLELDLDLERASNAS